MRYPPNPVFWEHYGTFNHYGKGSMLVFWSGKSLQYVMFTPDKSFKKEVIDKELLEKYKKDVVEA